jgi:hypothetical protein
MVGSMNRVVDFVASSRLYPPLSTILSGIFGRPLTSPVAVTVLTAGFIIRICLVVIGQWLDAVRMCT